MKSSSLFRTGSLAVVSLFTLWAISTTPVFAQSSGSPAPLQENIFAKIFHAVSGYYKSLNFFSKITDTREDYFGALQRLRLALESKFNDNLSLNLVGDHEILFNDFSHTGDFNLIRQKNLKDLAFLDTDRVITDINHIYERILLYRAFMTYKTSRSRVVIGKQLIDWGRMRFYSPLDIFNSPLPTDLEPDERIGFDAVNVELSEGPFGGLNFVYGPGHDEFQTSFGLKYTRKINTYDTTVLVAKHQKDKLIGAGFDGYLGPMGFRGEAASIKNGPRYYPRASIGLDHNFPGQIYLLAEYFYNGEANGDYDDFSSSLLVQRQRLSLQKHLIGLMASRDVTPLWTLKCATIYDCIGKSAFFNPEVRYNIRENLDASCGAHLFVASANSEFQNDRNLYYIEMKCYF